MVPPWYKDFHERPHRPEIILSSPPRGHPVEYIHGIPPPQTHQHYPTDWEHSGPGLGSEYVKCHHEIKFNISLNKINIKNPFFFNE